MCVDCEVGYCGSRCVVESGRCMEGSQAGGVAGRVVVETGGGLDLHGRQRLRPAIRILQYRDRNLDPFDETFGQHGVPVGQATYDGPR